MQNIVSLYGMKVNFEDLEEYVIDNDKYLDDLLESLNITNFQHIDGEVSYLLNNRVENIDNVYLAKLNKSPGLFNQAYKDINEIKEELKERFKSVLPEDYDYMKNIVLYTGSLTNNYWL